ncbi:MAG: VanZ family protein [Gammaproteobacteria bacterium]
MTILLALTPSRPQAPGFQFIASLSNGDVATQLVVAQWRDELIVMNGDDYSYERRAPRVAAELKRFLNRPILLAIVTSDSGTQLMVDGEVVGRNKSLQLFVPVDERGSRLTLGNSVNLSNGWSGVLYGFTLIPRRLTLGELRRDRDDWFMWHDLNFLAPEEALVLLHFTNGPSNLIRDLAGSGGDAVLPAWPVPVERSFLADDPTRKGLDRSRLRDVIANLIGFIPFGFALAALLVARRRQSVGSIIVIVTLWGFLVSLGIETVQAWIPTRSSSLLDLLLNTVGATIGACLRYIKSR